MADYLTRVYILTLKWDTETGSVFTLRVGDIIEETIHNCTIRLKKPKGGYLNILWDRKEGTLFNWIMALPNSGSILLKSDKEEFIDEATVALDKYFRSTLSHDEELFIKAFELGFITTDGQKTDLGHAFDKGYVDNKGETTKEGKAKLELDGDFKERK